MQEYLQLRQDNLGIFYPTYTMPYGSRQEDIDPGFVSYVRQMYQANGVVFATIQARISLFSEARLQWQRMGGGRPGDLFGTQELSVLETPWPNATTGNLLATMEQDVSLAGNSFIAREPDRLRWRRPDWMSIVLTAPPDIATTSDVIGYRYEAGGIGMGGEVEFYTTDEMCHWAPIPDPCAQFRGMSWLQPIVQEVSADLAMTKHKRKFLDNAATPNLAVTPKMQLTKEQFKEFMAITDEATRGTENAGKTLYLGFGADVHVVGADMKQMDFAVTQGHGETRICAAGRVPAIIVGVSEGLASATYSNYGQARRAFGDHWARGEWRSVCGALASIVDPPPGGPARLWYDDRDVAFLREDQKDAADIQGVESRSIRTLLDAGYLADSVVAAVAARDWTLLQHSGLFSVQLQPPNTGPPPTPDPNPGGQG